MVQIFPFFDCSLKYVNMYGLQHSIAKIRIRFRLENHLPPNVFGL